MFGNHTIILVGWLETSEGPRRTRSAARVATEKNEMGTPDLEYFNNTPERCSRTEIVSSCMKWLGRVLRRDLYYASGNHAFSWFEDNAWLIAMWSNFKRRWNKRWISSIFDHNQVARDNDGLIATNIKWKYLDTSRDRMPGKATMIKISYHVYSPLLWFASRRLLIDASQLLAKWRRTCHVIL